MTETDTQAGGTAGANAGANAGEGQAPSGPAVQIQAQYLKDLSFENPNAVTLMFQRQAPQVSVHVDVKANPIDDGQRTEVVLHLRCDASVNDTQAFIIEIEYGAVVSVAPSLSRERRAAALMIEVPTLMFPFARAVVADASREGGFPPLMIQPIDFVAMFRRQLESLRERMAGQGDGQADGQSGDKGGGSAPSPAEPGHA